MKKLLILLGVMLLLVQFALAGSVERSFDVASASPGDVVTVTLKLIPTSAEIASTASTTVLTDTPPAGWKISGLSDPKKCSIKSTAIGCLNSNEALTNTFTYKVTIPSDAETSTFNGEFTFSSVDGDQTKFDSVTGSTKLTVGAKVVCGDGTKDSSEQCDDKNNGGGDGCSATCTLETGYYVASTGKLACTTGYAQSEEAPAGKLVCKAKSTGPQAGDSCQTLSGGASTTATLACVDKIWTACTNSGDYAYVYYCNADGSWETCAPGAKKVFSKDDAYVCEDGQWSAKAACGDGKLATPAEQCDDKNTEDADGCSATCTLETGYVLGGQTDVLGCAQGYDAKSNDLPIVCIPGASILDLDVTGISAEEQLFLTKFYFAFQKSDVDVVDVFGFVSVFATLKDLQPSASPDALDSKGSGISVTETLILKKLYQLSEDTEDLDLFELIRNVAEVVPWFKLQ